MTDLILYAPGLAYFAFASLMFALKKFSFKIHSAVLFLAMIGMFYLAVVQDGSMLIAIAQVFFAVLSFVLMVFFFAGKASGETMVLFTALVALTPFALSFERGLIVFGATLVILLIYSSFFYNKQLSNISKIAQDMVDNKEKEDNVNLNGDTLKDTLLVGLLSTYNGQLKAPDYSYLPDKSETAAEKKISISIFAFAAFILVALGDFMYLSFILEG